MFAAIRAIAYHLPEGILTNQDLEGMFPEWSAEKIVEKTGIERRHVVAPHECASDLAYGAGRKLLATGVCAPEAIDFVLFCSQSPDYLIPATACLLQDRLGLPTHAGALDYNFGCSGYVYGLSLAKGLVESKQAKNVLLLTADTATKYLHPQDRGLRSLLGDAGAATLVQAQDDTAPRKVPSIGPFIFGTDGQGRDHLIIRTGGARQRTSTSSLCADEPNAGESSIALPSPEHLFMNGPEIFTFALRVVPQAVKQVLQRAETTLDAIDLFVFHQANGYMLEHLRQRLMIPTEKFVVALRHFGNTSSASIPIALSEANAHQQLRPGMRVLLVTFGAGYSWGATLIQWT